MIINSYRFATAAGGNFGNASRLFTSGDYIDMGDVLDTEVWVGATSFSLAMWVKPSNLSTSPIIFSKLANSGSQRQWYFRLLSSGEIAGIVYNSGGTAGYRSAKSTATSISDSTWHHVVMTVDQSQTGQLNIFDFYINGTQTNAATWLAAYGSFDGMNDMAASLQISGIQDASVVPYTGNIADVRIYDKILSASECSDLHAGTDVSDSLVGWWLDDDDDVLDNAGTNDGTNNGTTYSTDGPLD